jgi:hypothetical protein
MGLGRSVPRAAFCLRPKVFRPPKRLFLPKANCEKFALGGALSRHRTVTRFTQTHGGWCYSNTGEFHPMRDWIDQLWFIERVAIVVLVFVIVILQIADIADLGKVVFMPEQQQ